MRSSNVNTGSHEEVHCPSSWFHWPWLTVGIIQCALSSQVGVCVCVCVCVCLADYE